MKMEISFASDPDLDLRKLAKKFGEDAAEATSRLAVSAGKNLANKSFPWGLGRPAKDTIRENVEISAGRVCYVVKDPSFMAKLKKGGRGARVKYKAGFGGWQQVTPEQIKTKPEEINRAIDKVRAGKKNPPRWIPWSKMIVCSQSAFNRAMTARRKRIGMNKGGWLGAGIAAARLQGGPERAKIGKNVASWAQKHAKMGRAAWDGTGKFIDLFNDTSYATALLPRSAEQLAMEHSWEDTTRWYQKAIKRRAKDWRT